MTVNDPIFRMLFEKNSTEMAVSSIVDPVKPGKAEYPAAKLSYLLIEIALSLLVHEEIELDLITIDLAIEIHYHGFGAAAVHRTYHMKHSYHGFPLSNTLVRRIVYQFAIKFAACFDKCICCVPP